MRFSSVLALVLGLILVPSALAQSDSLVVFETSLGTITVELFDDDAPLHAANLRMLTDSGSYNSTLFHRIIPGFMIQGGDPNTIDGDPSTWGQGGPSGSVPAEFNDIRHERGILSMARSADPNSAGSQFFIVHNSSNFLDGQYTAFGRIVTAESFETLDAIAALETRTGDVPVDIESARILDAHTISRQEAGILLEQDDVLRIDSEQTTLDPVIPKTMDNLKDGVYSNNVLGISFALPTGWTLDEPNKTRPHIPDVIMTGIAPLGTLPPTIMLNTQFAGSKSIEDFVDAKIESYSLAIDSGALSIDSKENMTVNDRDSVIIHASGTFNLGDKVVDVKFKEVIFESDKKFQAFRYTTLATDFDSYLDVFDATLASIVTPDAAAQGGGCLIATAAYGTEMANEIQMLREIRDASIMNTALGSMFMDAFNNIYYTFSPTIADLERQSPEFRSVVRTLITPMIASLSIMSFADSESENNILLLGTLVIALNIGIYIVSPIAIALRLKR